MSYFIKGASKNSYVLISPSDIYYIEALKNYVKIFLDPLSNLGKEMIVTYVSLSKLEQDLDPNLFIRISRSIIIAKNKIVEIDGNIVKLKSGLKLDIGPVYKSNVYAFIRSNALI